MGVDISHIIKNDFHEIENHDKALQYVKETMERLSEFLHIPYQSDEDWRLIDEYIDPNPAWRENAISFRLPVYDVEFNLQNGFWQIESFHHYCQIVMHHGTYFWLRELTFDLARALGQSEAWYAAEYYTWNGFLDTTGPTFEEWLAHCRTEYGKEIPEFDRSAILAQGDVHIPAYEPLYHDDFKECREEMTRIENLVGDRGKVIGLDRTSSFIRCRVGEGINLYDEDTDSMIFENSVEDILNSLNGPEFLVKKGDMTALYDKDGKPMSDFVSGNWEWHWYGPSWGRQISNSVAGLSFIIA